jgi:hypothetical protein
MVHRADSVTALTGTVLRHGTSSLISLICFSWIYLFSILAGNVTRSESLEKRFPRKTVRYKRPTRDIDNEILR